MVPALKASRSAVMVSSLPWALNSLSTIAEMALYWTSSSGRDIEAIFEMAGTSMSMSSLMSTMCVNGFRQMSTSGLNSM